MAVEQRGFLRVQCVLNDRRLMSGRVCAACSHPQAQMQALKVMTPELTQLTAAIDRAECLLGTAAAGVRVWESIEVRSLAHVTHAHRHSPCHALSSSCSLPS